MNDYRWFRNQEFDTNNACYVVVYVWISDFTNHTLIFNCVFGFESHSYFDTNRDTWKAIGLTRPKLFSFNNVTVLLCRQLWLSHLPVSSVREHLVRRFVQGKVFGSGKVRIIFHLFCCTKNFDAVLNITEFPAVCVKYQQTNFVNVQFDISRNDFDVTTIHIMKFHVANLCVVTFHVTTFRHVVLKMFI